MSEWTKGCIAAAAIMVFGIWSAVTGAELVAEEIMDDCGLFGKFERSGHVFECRPIQSDHAGEGA